MNFVEAIKAVKETGQDFRRAAWDETGLDSLRWAHGRCNRATSSAPYVCELADMLADDWEVVSKTMSFADAVKCMRQGHRVRRLAWPSLRMASKLGCFEYYYNDSPYMGTGIMAADVEADDWVVVEDEA